MEPTGEYEVVLVLYLHEFDLNIDLDMNDDVLIQRQALYRWSLQVSVK